MADFHPHSFKSIPFSGSASDEDIIERQGIYVPSKPTSQSTPSVGDAITADRYNDCMNVFAPEKDFSLEGVIDEVIDNLQIYEVIKDETIL